MYQGIYEGKNAFDKNVLSYRDIHAAMVILKKTNFHNVRF